MLSWPGHGVGATPDFLGFSCCHDTFCCLQIQLLCPAPCGGGALAAPSQTVQRCPCVLQWCPQARSLLHHPWLPGGQLATNPAQTGTVPDGGKAWGQVVMEMSPAAPLRCPAPTAPLVPGPAAGSPGAPWGPSLPGAQSSSGDLYRLFMLAVYFILRFKRHYFTGSPTRPWFCERR